MGLLGHISAQDREDIERMGYDAFIAQFRPESQEKRRAKHRKKPLPTKYRFSISKKKERERK